MSPIFTALDSVLESGITIASDGAEYKSKFLGRRKLTMATYDYYEISQKLANLIL